jgi:galactokinase
LRFPQANSDSKIALQLFLSKTMTSPKTHTADEVSRMFHQRFAEHGKVFQAPGRVNLIGEHTDYNQGFVLPAAIDFSCWVAASPRRDNKLVIYSDNFGEQIKVDLEASQNWTRKGWPAYPLGVAWSLQQAGYSLRGSNLYIAGDVPLGSGLSSSAAIEVATALALLDDSMNAIDRTELALLCQRAENDFVGARCGIMDQFIACHGKAGHSVLLDCRSLQARLIPIPKDVALVICNSMVKHEIAANEYNKRRMECEQAVRLLKSAHPSIQALRDVSSEQLETHRNLLPPLIYKRVRHVVTEDERTLLASSALEKGDLQPLAKWMAESHQSMRDDYEISCRELDILVELAATQKGLLGARMTGGGFGGCTINLVRQEFVHEFIQTVEEEYFKRTGLRTEILSMKSADAAGLGL